MDRALEIVNRMTTQQKAEICSGRDFWSLKGFEELGLPSVTITDGPHGLRKQAGEADHLGLNESVPATCFPTACASAASFDPALLRDIGSAMGEECQQEDVAVILGPGTNIKRSPLCGRNFEYFSEDPLLSGELSAGMILGIQGKGVGTSLKHFAANSQETARLVSNSVVDMRTLREIYLPAFETAVQKAQPATIMCAYNQINGTYASDDEWLLTDVLRKEWGFEGLVVSDWGAVNNRAAGIRAGMDLEMPSSGGAGTDAILEALQNGGITEAQLDACAARVVRLILQYVQSHTPGYRYDVTAHHSLARHAAASSAVLLKNADSILPLNPSQNVAVIGGFARTPRYQGSGSSKINPHMVDDAVQALQQAGVSLTYADGYSLNDMQPQPQLIEEACAAARTADVAVIFAGLPDEYESEGFDRTSLAMPDSHNSLIEAVAAANPNTVVVLQCGAPVQLPWLERVRGVLLMYLGGEAVNGAAADVLLGSQTPGGKLPESWPLTIEDTPCSQYYPGKGRTAEYREGVFVGYRYYDTAQRPVAFPFGFGLSYTSFSIAGLKAAATFAPGGQLAVECTVTNTGPVAGAEVVQLYVAPPKGGAVPRPAKELRGFKKVQLQPGESQRIGFILSTRSFAYFNTATNGWAVEGGKYTLLVGNSSRNITQSTMVEVVGDGAEAALAAVYAAAPAYRALPAEGPWQIPDADFAAVYGAALPPATRPAGTPFDENSTLREAQATFIGRQLKNIITQQAGKMLGGADDIQRMMDAMLMDMPLRSLVMFSGGALTRTQLDGLIALLNGRPVRGIAKLVSGGKKTKDDGSAT